MACPGGCASGGGQYITTNDSQGNDEIDKLKDNIKFIEGIQKKIHEGGDVTVIEPDEIPIVRTLFDYLVIIDKKMNNNNAELPFLRNDFVSANDASLSSLKW